MNYRILKSLMRTTRFAAIAVLGVILMLAAVISAADGFPVQRRIVDQIREGKPIVVQVIVCLADNRYQGIAPLSPELGNGQIPSTNLYWGAKYGVKTFLTDEAGWEVVDTPRVIRPGMLQSVVLKKWFPRGLFNGVDVYLVAEAWEGEAIKAATKRFLAIAAGDSVTTVAVKKDDKTIRLPAGGAADIVAYVGHNGLMDFTLDSLPVQNADALPRSAIILANATKPYFQKYMAATGSHVLLWTTGVISPGAFTLDAAVESCVRGDNFREVLDNVAETYSKYEDCSIKAARSLFEVEH
jgi:hypothetical protein